MFGLMFLCTRALRKVRLSWACSASFPGSFISFVIAVAAVVYIAPVVTKTVTPLLDKLRPFLNFLCTIFLALLSTNVVLTFNLKLPQSRPFDSFATLVGVLEAGQARLVTRHHLLYVAYSDPDWLKFTAPLLFEKLQMAYRHFNVSLATNTSEALGLVLSDAYLKYIFATIEHLVPPIRSRYCGVNVVVDQFTAGQSHTVYLKKGLRVQSINSAQKTMLLNLRRRQQHNMYRPLMCQFEEAERYGSKYVVIERLKTLLGPSFWMFQNGPHAHVLRAAIKAHFKDMNWAIKIDML